jgi:hypothetical protein
MVIVFSLSNDISHGSIAYPTTPPAGLDNIALDPLNLVLIEIWHRSI